MYLFTIHSIMFIFFCIEWDKLFNISQIIISKPSLINNTNQFIYISNSNITNITSNTLLNYSNNYSIYKNNLTDNNFIIKDDIIEIFFELKNYISFSSFHRHKNKSDYFLFFIYAFFNRLFLFLHYIY